MKYLKELGIDDEVARLAAAIARQQAKHITYHFLQDIRSFLNDDDPSNTSAAHPISSTTSTTSTTTSNLPSEDRQKKGTKKGKGKVD
jgi:hypothetical protein